MATHSTPDAARRRLGVGAAIVVVVLALAVTIGIGIVRAASTPTEQLTLPTDAATDAVTDAAVYVHVAGAVGAPGLYRLLDGARVVDAVAAAGGFAADADTDAVNLARSVDDGEQLVVPRIGEAAAPSQAGGTSAAAPSSGARVNLNTADAAALDTLPRIGPALAQRIIDWRAQNGRFTSVDDLLAVPGIGDRMLESIRDLVTV